MPNVSIRFRARRAIVFSIVAVAIVFPAIGARSAAPAALQAADGTPAADTCILELILPAGASATVDGRKQGTKRTVTYRGLKPESIAPAMVVVRFKGGQSVERQVWVQPGRRVRLALGEPNATRPELVAQTGHPGGAALYAAMSHDGRFLLTSHGPQAILWDVATGRQLRAYPGGADALHSVAFMADNQRLMAASYGGQVAVYDAATGRETVSFRVDGCFRAALAPDGATIAVDGPEGAILLYDTASGRRLREFQGAHKNTVEWLAYSPDGKRVVSASADETAIVWDAKTGRKLLELASPAGGFERALFSPDGRRIVTTAYDDDPETRAVRTTELTLWDAATGTRLAAWQSHSEQVGQWTFSRDGRWLIVPVFRRMPSREHPARVDVLDAETLKTERTLAENPGGALGIAAPDGRTVFDGRYLWSLESGDKVRTFGGQISHATVRDLQPGDGGYALLSSGVAVDVFDLAQAAIVRRIKPVVAGSGEWMRNARFFAEGQRILALVGSEQGTRCAVYDAVTGDELEKLSLGPGLQFNHRLTPDGQFLFVGTQKTATLWDLTAKRAIRTFRPDRYNTVAIAIAPDGRRLALAPAERDRFDALRIEHDLATIVDARSGRELRTFQTSSEIKEDRPYVSWYDTAALDFSPDGKYLATGGAEFTSNPDSNCGVVLLWDAENGDLIRALHIPDHVEKVGFSQRGDYLLARSAGNTVSVWHLASGQKLLTVPHFEINLPQLTPDGRYLLTTASENAIVVWDVATGTRLASHLLLHDGEDWLTVTPEGLFDGSARARQQVMFRVGGGLNLVSVDRFFQDFYRPGLMADLLHAERPLPEVTLGHAQPPRVKIVSPESGAVTSAEATITAEAVDQGGGISGLSVRQNGVRVVADGESHQEGKTVYRTFKLQLIEGANEIRVTAASGDGSWESEPARVVLLYDRPLERKSQLHVVAIGINRYADGALNLSYAASDAEAMADLFRRRGGALYGDVHVTTVLDEQATKAGIKETLQAVAAQTRPQDTLVLFLSGHGAMVGQRYYFVPHELARTADRLEDDLRAQGLPADELSEYLGAAKALKRVLILDTCASGGALGVALKTRSGFALRGAVERLSRSQGVFTIAAAAAGAEAQESPQLRHGVLSYALLAALGGVSGGPLDGQEVQPSGKDRVVDVMEWFTFAAGQVPRLTELLFGAPQDVQTSTQGNSFPVLPLDD
ncbi:MAG: PQQ-binding-like beta-propeller repeat protein [Planctomycetia bacterium]|nr:PQQ-binding-like beta-propeller repeat protein [Planctomycetia bacterium]